jgi:H+/Na+-translocating ferredoxin:NAD+ oxidoreductase subunit B
MDQLILKLEMSEDEIRTNIASIIKKGGMMEVEGKSAVRYALNDGLFVFYRMPGWKGEDNEMNKKLAPMINKYYIDHMGAEFMGHPTKGLRAIPVAGTIKDTRKILPYEEILQYVDQEDYHTVSECACRQRHNLDPFYDKCEHETTNCLHFGQLGRYIVKQGMGKVITKDETMEIIKNAADAGLVHGISNYKNKMDTICNCCSCCCLFLEKINIDPPNPRGHQRSNYALELNNETCKACGLCESRCPVDALELKDKNNIPEAKNGAKLKPKDLKELSYDTDKCIGCGVCAHKCPTQSLTLVKRDGPDEDIPESPSEAGKRMLGERNRDFAKIF